MVRHSLALGYGSFAREKELPGRMLACLENQMKKSIRTKKRHGSQTPTCRPFSYAVAPQPFARQSDFTRLAGGTMPFIRRYSIICP
jgi:hypothetical protein